MTDNELPSELENALGFVVAELRRQWTRERQLIEDQANAIVARLRGEIAELRAELDKTVRERLAAVRDGDKGDPGAQGPPGEKGEKGDVGEQGPQGASGAAGPPGEKGDCGARGEQGPQGEIGARGEQGERGETGPPGPAGTDGAPGAPGPIGEKGDKGDRGEKGEQGPRGVLPIAKAYEPDSVHYAGDVVVHQGSTWQARKDTGQTPPHADWIGLAFRGIDGVDGRTPQICGTWDPAREYRELDLVAFSNGTFIAKRDKPGPCPGEGWQLVAGPGRVGKQGPPGERGPAGDRGDRGAPGSDGADGRDGASIIGWRIERGKFCAIPLMSNRKDGPALELRGLFEEYNEQATP